MGSVHSSLPLLPEDALVALLRNIHLCNVPAVRSACRSLHDVEIALYLPQVLAASLDKEARFNALRHEYCRRETVPALVDRVAWPLDVLPMLLQTGIHVNSRGRRPKGCSKKEFAEQSCSLLWEAASAGQGPAVAALVAAGATVNEESRGCTPLFAAVSRTVRQLTQTANVAAVRALIEGKADVNAGSTADSQSAGRRAEATPPLVEAARGGDLEIVELLVGARAEVDPPTSWTPLTAAARGGHVDVVGLLCKANADINVQKDGWDALNPMSTEASCGHAAVVELLLEINADVDAADNQGRTAVYIAAAEASVSRVGNPHPPWDERLVYTQRAASQLRIVRSLIAAKADVNKAKHEEEQEEEVYSGPGAGDTWSTHGPAKPQYLTPLSLVMSRVCCTGDVFADMAHALQQAGATGAQPIEPTNRGYSGTPIEGSFDFPKEVELVRARLGWE